MTEVAENLGFLKNDGKISPEEKNLLKGALESFYSSEDIIGKNFHIIEADIKDAMTNDINLTSSDKILLEYRKGRIEAKLIDKGWKKPAPGGVWKKADTVSSSTVNSRSSTMNSRSSNTSSLDTSKVTVRDIKKAYRPYGGGNEHIEPLTQEPSIKKNPRLVSQMEADFKREAQLMNNPSEQRKNERVIREAVSFAMQNLGREVRSGERFDAFRPEGINYNDPRTISENGELSNIISRFLSQYGRDYTKRQIGDYSDDCIRELLLKVRDYDKKYSDRRVEYSFDKRHTMRNIVNQIFSEAEHQIEINIDNALEGVYLKKESKISSIRARYENKGISWEQLENAESEAIGNTYDYLNKLKFSYTNEGFYM